MNEPDEMIRKELAQKYPQMDDETLNKLVLSRKAVQGLETRKIRCPKCHSILMETYIKDHELVIVKCKKCRFMEPMDIAYFRRIRMKNREPECIVICGAEDEDYIAFGHEQLLREY